PMAWRPLGAVQRHKKGGKSADLSGVGDSRRGIDATARPGRRIMRSHRWTARRARRYAGIHGPCGARVAKGTLHLRSGAPVLMAGVFWFALSSATTAVAVAAAGRSSATAGSGSQPVVPTSTTVPSIEILGNQTGLAGTCGGSAFDVNTFINIGSSAS